MLKPIDRCPSKWACGASRVEVDSTDNLANMTKQGDTHIESIKEFLRGYNLK